MRIFLNQIYVKVGVEFPFSFGFQQWISEVLSERVEVSEKFCNKYGPDFKLVFRISAKDDIDEPDTRGPTVFRRTKSVEFTIFLPHKLKNYHDVENALSLLQQLLQSVIIVLRRLDLNASKVLEDIENLQNEFLGASGLIDGE